MNIFPGANPAFLTHNYLNRHAKNASDLTVTTGDTLKHRLYDMDPLSRWQSAESDDLTTETIEFGLWAAGGRMSHDVEYVAVMNHNVLSMTIELSNDNGGAWTEVFSSTAIDEANTRVPLVSTPADRVRVSLLTTQTADEEKKVGDIVVAGASFQPGPLFKYDPEPYKIQTKTAKMADGSLRGLLSGRTDAGGSLWAARCSWVMDPADYSDRDAFDAAMATFRDYGLSARQFLFMPEPGDRPDQVYLCRVRPGTYVDPYLRLSEGRGGMLAVQMVIEEVGGA